MIQAPDVRGRREVIDSDTKAIKKQLFFGGPQFITFSPSGRSAYVATESDILLLDTAEVIAATEFQLTQQNFPAQSRIAVAGTTGSVAFSKSAEYAYTPIPSQNAVAVIKIGDRWR